MMVQGHYAAPGGDPAEVAVTLKFLLRRDTSGGNAIALPTGEPAQHDFTAGWLRLVGPTFGERFQRHLDAALNSLPVIEIGPDSSPDERSLAELRTRLQELSGERIGADIDAATALTGLREVATGLDSVRRVTLAPPVSPPCTGSIVRYRGKQGLHAVRAAIVTADVQTLDPRGVEAGHVPALDSPEHVHLWVYTPSEAIGGGFAEFNVGPGDEPGTWHWPSQGERL
ncbi:hypothetical protein [Sphaerisporangium aureirubrum]|uniref:Uncharacterized protein n=1 Tax=Sphaerisporangium aureirubrum TaxID=1544736 RepID=A0ABW1NDA6_9ACTN